MIINGKRSVQLGESAVERRISETVSNTQDNFSFNPPGDGFYRLLVLGGPKSGYTSNAVSVSLPLVETRFAGWGLDQGMFITGVMSPWVACGMTASFHVRKLSDDSVVEGGLTYQWYRVNPMASEMVLIPGATGLTYETWAMSRWCRGSR